ncbi:alpha/beta fold hydrolase [Ruegeria lacuscaerulensis]|uniref:alpha/beta fold hydrolase n=1 Tax=Ruegeria lacuscaerulensis TaxID=55218 RepID=UPI00147D23DE|nr:alpha/beta hydrolase [Ruegeria lacuscaerulensis]
MIWQDGGSGRMDVNGTELEYGTWGPAPQDAPTIVMLHEGLGCLAMWRDFPAEISAATGFGVLAYSRSGYGQSGPAELPRPLDYMTVEAQQVLGPVLDQAGIQRAVLLGHSDGATIAAIYAGSVSDQRVRGLILMAPHFFTEETGLASIAAARGAFDTGDLAGRLASYHRDPAATFNGWCDAWLDPGFRNWNVADVIDYLRIPTLAIQGRDDQYGTLAQIAEVETRSYAPVETAILDNCRHAPQFDQPTATLTAIAEFTARLERLEQAMPEMA